MAIFVNTNVAGLSGQNNLQRVTDRMNSSFEKLSSGSRINSARDDSAGLQISDRLTTQINGLNQANRNANDGISVAQIAEGALSEITSNVQRMRQLVVQGGNRTLSSDDRNALSEEFKKLLNTNNDITDRTAYGELKLLNNSSPEGGFQIQSGAQSGEQDTITTGNAELTALFGKIAKDELNSASMSALTDTANLANYGTIGKITLAYMAVNGVSSIDAAADALFGNTRSGTTAQLGTDDSQGAIVVSNLTTLLEKSVVATQANASMIDVAIDGKHGLTLGTVTSGWSDAQVDSLHNFATDTLLDAMSGLVTQVDKQRAKLGAEQNGLSSMIRNNSTAVVNVSDSRARIMDTDFATETAELTRNQIIQQAATSILSQANQLPQTALSLLR